MYVTIYCVYILIPLNSAHTYHVSCVVLVNRYNHGLIAKTYLQIVQLTAADKGDARADDTTIQLDAIITNKSGNKSKIRLV